MVKTQLNGQKAVQDYFSSLLLDSTLDVDEQKTPKRRLRFAQVARGFELSVLWQTPMTRPQLLCKDLMALSFLRTVSGPKLRRVLLNSINTIERP